MTTALLYGIAGAGAIASILLLSSMRVFSVHDRAVIFRLGRVVGSRGPGLFFVVPVLDGLVKVSTQTAALTIPHQEVVTRDSVTVNIDAVAYINVIDPVRAVMAVDDYRYAIHQAAQTALRSIIGRFELDDLLAQRDEVNQQLQQSVSLVAEAMGISVKLIEMRDLQLPEGIRRAMARQAEAERELRAKVIYAQGESEAAESLGRTAAVLERHPAAMQLKVLSTMAELSGKQGNTLIFPVPVELLRLVEKLGARAGT